MPDILGGAVHSTIDSIERAGDRAASAAREVTNLQLSHSNMLKLTLYEMDHPSVAKIPITPPAHSVSSIAPLEDAANTMSASEIRKRLPAAIKPLGAHLGQVTTTLGNSITENQQQEVTNISQTAEAGDAVVLQHKLHSKAQPPEKLGSTSSSPTAESSKERPKRDS